ncbi:hypothetical protein DPSP01_009922 [Paraphaeosphaeria sporulosa]
MKRAGHVEFLELCHTCNYQFTDKQIFEENHGHKGEKCHNPRKQARGEKATNRQWWELSNLVNYTDAPEITLTIDATDTRDERPSIQEETGSSRLYQFVPDTAYGEHKHAHAQVLDRETGENL